jgi:bacillithiol system protein YtxJ
MGLFGLFGSKNSSEEKVEKVKKVVPWHRLNSLEQLKTIAEESKTKPVAIFKHSTRCGISRMVLNQFESSYNLDDTQLKLYFLDLLSNRDISDEVGFMFQVMHQSPQLIVVKNGNTVHQASHSSIQAHELEKFI